MESSNSHLLWGWELGEVINFIIGVISYLRILNTLEQKLLREWEKRRNEFKQNFNKQQQHGFCFDWEEGIQRTNGSNVLIKCSLVFLMEKKCIQIELIHLHLHLLNMLITPYVYTDLQFSKFTFIISLIFIKIRWHGQSRGYYSHSNKRKLQARQDECAFMGEAKTSSSIV